MKMYGAISFGVRHSPPSEMPAQPVVRGYHSLLMHDSAVMLFWVDFVYYQVETTDQKYRTKQLALPLESLSRKRTLRRIAQPGCRFSPKHNKDKLQLAATPEDEERCAPVAQVLLPERKKVDELFAASASSTPHAYQRHIQSPLASSSMPPQTSTAIISHCLLYCPRGWAHILIHKSATSLSLRGCSQSLVLHGEPSHLLCFPTMMYPPFQTSTILFRPRLLRCWLFHTGARS